MVCYSKKILILLVLLLSFQQQVHATAYGSDTAVSIVNPFNIPTGQSNIINTFGCATNGFAFADANTTCSFNSVFPVAGPVSLNCSLQKTTATPYCT